MEEDYDFDIGHDSGSDSSIHELESELYSVLHYHSFSEDLPAEILEKYNIKRNDKNEFLISLKVPASKHKEAEGTSETPKPSGNSGKFNEESPLLNSEEQKFPKDLPENYDNVIEGSSGGLCKPEGPILSLTPIKNVPNVVNKIVDKNKSQRKKNRRKSKKYRASNSALTPHNLNLYCKTFCNGDEDNSDSDIVIISDDNFQLNSNANKCKKKLSQDVDVICISETDSEKSSDSDVVILEKEYEVCNISSSSSVECLSDSDGVRNMMLNTTQKTMQNSTIFPAMEGEEEVIKIKWREVASPSTWSDSMKKYYNKASKRLKYFDCDKIREEIRGKGTWEINDEDRFPRQGRPPKRCSFCRQVDHLMKDCPKRFSNCSVCGNPGHYPNNCPFRMCLNCGKHNSVFVSLCHNCEHDRFKTCDECHQIGHVKSNCPDTWRRYHSTTSEGLNVKPSILNENLMCCNCGKKGHLYEHCESIYWSSYPPNSFLVKKYAEPNISPGKRKLHDGIADLVTNEKKPRWSDEGPSFNRSNTPGKEKKQRWSDQNFKFNRRRYFDFSPDNQMQQRNNNKKRTPNSKKKKRKGYRHNQTF